MENKENTPENKSGFMQGGGFIILIVVVVTTVLLAFKFLLNL